ncbi:protein REBELOTE isoform X2 [Amaranthus tricolor]|nr:protein REBELOTE isoform X2 [Amaranthus tricolor]
MVEDESDSDGFLSEDSNCSYAGGSDTELHLEDAHQSSDLHIHNQKLLSELSKKKKRLDALKRKDPRFVIFLQEHLKSLDSLDDEQLFDEDGSINQNPQSFSAIVSNRNAGKLLSMSTIKNWGQKVKEEHSLSAFRCLLNAYRAACLYGSESTKSDVPNSFPLIQNKDTFCGILMFMLSEGDKLLRDLLELSANCKRESIVKLKNSSKWESVKLMVKSFLKSTLFLLNQFTDLDILVYALNQLRVSLVFFAAYPSLECKLTEVAVHLWATGEGTLSSCSFLVLRDLASFFGQESYENCLKETYKAFISRCKVVDSTSLKHIEFMKASFIELCSIDMQKSVKVALASAQKLSLILKLGLQTKKEALKKICSWEYVLCIDLWVKFVSSNIKDNDLHGLLYILIQVINGVAKLFAGQRYLPVRVKCVQWLNELSASSDVFIPVASLALDILESSNTQEAGKFEKGGVNLSSILKLPKYWLKSQDFQEECVFSAVELLCAHFIKWCYHISYPELATVPVIRLKNFHEKSTFDSLRRPVKRLIDQIEKNMDFVQRKREEVSFSPIDQASADAFLLSEKHNDNSPFIQYYKSTTQNAMTRKFNNDDHKSHKKPKGKKLKMPRKTEVAGSNGMEKYSMMSDEPSNRSQQVTKRKKQKTGAT